MEGDGGFPVRISNRPVSACRKAYAGVTSFLVRELAVSIFVEFEWGAGANGILEWSGARRGSRWQWRGATASSELFGCRQLFSMSHCWSSVWLWASSSGTIILGAEIDMPQQFIPCLLVGLVNCNDVLYCGRCIVWSAVLLGDGECMVIDECMKRPLFFLPSQEKVRGIPLKPPLKVHLSRNHQLNPRNEQITRKKYSIVCHRLEGPAPHIRSAENLKTKLPSDLLPAIGNWHRQAIGTHIDNDTYHFLWLLTFDLLQYLPTFIDGLFQ